MDGGGTTRVRCAQCGTTGTLAVGFRKTAGGLVTPARYAPQVFTRLSKGTHSSAAGQGLAQLATGCIPRLTAEFIAAGSTASLDEDCVRKIRPAPFLLSRSAPAP